MELLIDATGWCTQALQFRSPNCDDRPDTPITLLVIHNISLPPGKFEGDAVVDLFLNRLDPAADAYFASLADLKVSAHFFVRRDGSLVQFVSCAMRAWHAGVSRFGDRDRCNDFSIGVELEGTDVVPFTDAQYQTLASLTGVLSKHYPLTAAVGHSEIAPGRKTDPGPFFEWRRFSANLSRPLRPD